MRTRSAGAAVAALALVAAAGAATPKWNLVPGVPLPTGASNSQLQGVAVGSAHDVWTAGAWWDKDQVHPLLAHWDGTAWKTPELPVLPDGTYLGGVDALSATDVWAVGSTVDSLPGAPSLLHYQGLEWQTVPTPPPPAGSTDDLDAIDMRTASDGWAVGETSTGTSTQPLILRWQGGGWTAPKAALGAGGLVAVAAAGADDVWAVGNQVDGLGASHGLVLHFDGAAWAPVKVSTPAGTTLSAVAVAGPGDIWAAGQNCAAACTASVWHLSAAGWQSVPVAGGTEVAALVAFAPDNVWTLGYQVLANNAKGDHVERWNGKQLTAEDTGLPPIPPSASTQGELGSATPIFAAAGDRATGDLWAVGWSDPPTVMPRVIHRA
jgi:hypothetical protein